MEKKKDKKMEIELTKEEAPGTYSNLVMITHSPAEFVFDFIAIMPGLTKAKVVKRMILTPEHAKRFSNALKDNIRRYEELHGEIKMKGKNENDPQQPFNYRGPLPEA